MREQLESGRGEQGMFVEAFPPELAKNFVAGREVFVSNSPKVHEGDKTDIWRVFQRQEDISGIGPGSLVFDYRRYHQEKPGKFDRLQFEYLQPDPDAGDDERVIAQMHLQCIPDGSFILDHRHTHPEYRRKFGLGTRLYQQTESFLCQVATEEKHDITVGLQAGQVPVIDWAEKMGFNVIPEHRELLDEIRQHPDRFVEDDVYVSPESREEGIIKDRYTFRKGVDGRYMEDAIRITMRKTLSPAVEQEQTKNHSVRLATTVDAAAIAKIQHDSWLATYVNADAGIAREDLAEYLKDVASRVERWRGKLAESDASIRVFVLQSDDRVIGFCRVRRSEEYGHVEALYLDPAYSGKGLGGEVFQEALDWLGSEKPVELEVAAYNDRAIRFYERFGFRSHGAAKPLDLHNGKEIPLTAMVRDRSEE